MKVGIFDSGVGGLTVLKQMQQLMPSVDYIYYGDNKNVPYGTKTKEQVFKCVEQVVTFLIDQGAEAIVIACNTATGIAIDQLRRKYSLPIVGMEPAVKLALDNEKEGRILVTATPLALKEERIKALLERLSSGERVDTLALPGLVSFAESFNFSGKDIEEYLMAELKPFNLEKYSGIVLGCTHFIYFKGILRGLLPQSINIYDGNEGATRHLMKILNIEEESGIIKRKGNTVFYSSDESYPVDRFSKYLEVCQIK